jgi:hypothetical protein
MISVERIRKLNLQTVLDLTKQFLIRFKQLFDYDNVDFISVLVYVLYYSIKR